MMLLVEDSYSTPPTAYRYRSSGFHPPSDSETTLERRMLAGVGTQPRAWLPTCTPYHVMTPTPRPVAMRRSERVLSESQGKDIRFLRHLTISNSPAAAGGPVR